MRAMIDCRVTEDDRTPESRYRRAVSGKRTAGQPIAALVMALAAGCGGGLPSQSTTGTAGSVGTAGTTGSGAAGFGGAGGIGGGGIDGGPVGGCAWSLLNQEYRAVGPMFWDAPGQRLILIDHADNFLTLLPSPSLWVLPAAGARPSLLIDSRASVVHDISRRRILVFGSGGTDTASRLFELTLDDTPTWSEITMAGSIPSLRNGSAAALDPASDRMVVCCGSHYPDTFHDTAALALGGGGAPTWQSIDATSPFTDELDQPFGTIWDPARSRMLVRLMASGQIWSLAEGNGGSWVQLLADPALTHLDWQPGPRLDVYDPVGDALLVAGAIRTDDPNVDFALHLYRLPLGGTTSGFTEVAAGNRPRRSSVSGNYPMAYDPAADRLFVQIDGYNAGTKSEIWSLPLGECR